jgi:hypothetical protein
VRLLVRLLRRYSLARLDYQACGTAACLQEDVQSFGYV